jgi:hypothetical protein
LFEKNCYNMAILFLPTILYSCQLHDFVASTMQSKADIYQTRVSCLSTNQIGFFCMIMLFCIDDTYRISKLCIDDTYRIDSD